MRRSFNVFCLHKDNISRVVSLVTPLLCVSDAQEGNTQNWSVSVAWSSFKGWQFPHLPHKFRFARDPKVYMPCLNTVESSIQNYSQIFRYVLGASLNRLARSFVCVKSFEIRSEDLHYICALWCNWLRHCTTNLKVAGSIPDCVTGIFYWHNPFDLTVALGSTQPVTEMSIRNISEGVKAAGA
jgi:hypothetical protein